MTPIGSRDRRVAKSLRTRGFSLIEMLITFMIMMILFTMLYGFGSRKHQLTQKQKCQGNLQKIFIGLQIYANEHTDQFPVATNAQTAEDALDLLVPQYVADTGIFICPGSKDRALTPGVTLKRGRISYAYYMGRQATDANAVLLSDRQIDSRAKALGAQVFSDDGKKPANNHHKYGGNFLFCDGSTRTTSWSTPLPLPLSTNILLLNPKP
jgi:prepilin-type processing-associated H-X9-DG protein